MKNILPITCACLCFLTMPIHAEDSSDQASRMSSEKSAAKATLMLDAARKRISPEEYKEGLKLLDELQAPEEAELKEAQKEEQATLWNEQEQARRLAKVQQYRLTRDVIVRENAPVLSILNKAVAAGKVRETAVAQARNLVMSGRRDARSLKVIEATAWYCLSQLASNETERDQHLQRARLAQAGVVEMMNAVAASRQAVRR